MPEYDVIPEGTTVRARVFLREEDVTPNGEGVPIDAVVEYHEVDGLGYIHYWILAGDKRYIVGAPRIMSAASHPQGGWSHTTDPFPNG